MQRVVNDSRRPTNQSECIRKALNNCKKSNLPGKTPKSCPEKVQRPGKDTNTSGIHMHAQSGRIDATTAARIAGTISTSPNEQKRPNSPSDLETWCGCEADGLGNDADGSTVPTDVQNNGNDPKMATNGSRNVRKSHIRPKSQNSPIGHKVAMVKHPGRWRHISNEWADRYALQNSLIKFLGTQN